jgi:hypothetical protein
LSLHDPPQVGDGVAEGQDLGMLVRELGGHLFFARFDLVQLLPHSVDRLVRGIDDERGDLLGQTCDDRGERFDLGLRRGKVRGVGEEPGFNVADLSFQELAFAVDGDDVPLILRFPQASGSLLPALLQEL